LPLRHVLDKRLNLLLAAVLLLSIARLWIVQINVSFWVDEMVTVFVVHHGPNDPSLAIAPQVPKSIYYILAHAADAIAGVSEPAYRLPSILAMALALVLTGRLAARLIHPHAAWLAMFACLGLKGLNSEAYDARPYALGMCVSVAALWFLVKWLDSGRWMPAFGFVVFGTLVWRVHLLFWPLYLVFALYAIVRIVRSETKVRWPAALLVFVMLGITLIPVVYDAISILREAHAHVIMLPPTLRELTDAIKWKLVLAAFGTAALLDRIWRWSAHQFPISWTAIPLSSTCVILGWWLIHPLTLFAFSRLTGDSVFVPRYLSVALPGAAMAALLAAAWFIPLPTAPSPYWKYTALVFGIGVLVTVGNWRHPWTARANSDWRAAAGAIREVADQDTPVICISPFIEARPPEWRPDYPLPGFLYSFLPVYEIRGHPYLFPFADSPEAQAYAKELAHNTLPPTRRFVIYGGDLNVRRWRVWFERQPELAGWGARDLGAFGDVEAVVLEPGSPGRSGDQLRDR
jgi:hypothetical protein